MQAFVFDGQSAQVKTVPKPTSATEALIRVHLAGICTTDREILKGYGQFRGTLGHEFVGTVEACPDPGWEGRRVVGEINCPCRSCTPCQNGDSIHCPSRQVLGIHDKDGAMAEYCLLPVANLHEVPETLSDRQAVFAEPLAAAVAILQRIPIPPSQTVAVIGDGKLGLLVAQVLRLNGAHVLLIGRHPEKWTRMGNHAIEGMKPEEWPTGQKVDRVVECSGSPEGLRFALDLVRPRGKIIMKSTVHASYILDFSRLALHEISLEGSRCGPFEPALRLMSQGLIMVESLIDDVFALEQARDALAQAMKPGALKILLDTKNH
ncbi:MAG: alcohol dehydrogenase catalytic domain-containing protein [Magnetococcales bacterium]|nr:alcohol dehydrogenase catalytic domain-containing protein [Magnetococcales bacterium]MBF0346458.1 alcohol dehydrogenase catalytic domain-containing protein [Magnetococcales bacterium]